MGCCDLRTLSLVVAILNAFLYLIGIIWDIIFLNGEYERRLHWEKVKHVFKQDTRGNDDVHSGIILLIVYLFGLATSLLFVKGLHKKSMRLMAPFVYLITGTIIFSATSFIGTYNLYLIKAAECLDGIILGFTEFIGLCVYILFLSPIFLLYQKMRKPEVTKQQPCRVNHEEVKSNNS